MGKAYVHSDPAQRKESDSYLTPFSLVWKLLEKESFSNCWEPACGKNSIVKAAAAKGFKFEKETDIHQGKDFLKIKRMWAGDIWTNPPFSLWDEFVDHAKKLCTGRICMLGKTNFFGCAGRSRSTLWHGLHKVYIFNRYVDYRTTYREDGLFHVGNLCTAWFIWDYCYQGKWEIELLDVDAYAKLGSFEKKTTKIKAAV